MTIISDFSRISRAYVVEAVASRLSSAAVMQTALKGVVYQISKGNPDWLTEVINGFSEQSHGKTMVSSDGRQINAYMRFLGIPVQWNKENQRFKLKGKWKETDWDAIAHAMEHGERWDKFNKVAADKAFDLPKSAVSFFKRCDKEGHNLEEILNAVREAAKEDMRKAA